MDISKSFQDGLDKSFGELASDPNLAGKGIDVFKGRNEFRESEEFFEKWSKEYKDSIDCSKPKGFSQKAFCKGKSKKEVNEFATNLVGKTKMKTPIGKLFSIGKSENKEATASGSAGQFSTAFGVSKKTEMNEMMKVIDYKKLEKVMEVIKNEDPNSYGKIIDMIVNAYEAFDYEDVENMLKKSEKKDVHSKVENKMKDVEKSKLGNLTIDDLVEKHLKKGVNEDQLERKIRQVLRKGTKVEMEHTKDKKVAEKIAMDHLYEDLEYYTKLSKVEAKEATSSASSGQYTTNKIWAKSMNKKDWRGASKAQIPGGKFVTVKEKCRKFPYCNQGDIKALNIFENQRFKDIISKIQNKYNISENVIKYSIINELNKNKDIYK
jgi:hypothetical protein